MNAWSTSLAIATRAAAFAAAIALLHGCNGGDDAPPRIESQAPLEWSRIATSVFIEDGTLSPMEESRAYAMAFTAMHDALNAIDRRYAPYLSNIHAPDADPDAAIAAAVYGVLAAVLPKDSRILGDAYELALFNVRSGNARTAGIALGERVAAAIVAARANDGSANAQGPYTPDSAPGTYQVTPPINFAAFVNWGQVKPFTFPDIKAFRPEPPYSVLDATYAADFNEVKALGSINSTVRTAEQSEIAKFWLESTPQSMTRIAGILAEARKLNAWDQARLLALVQLAEADAYISVMDTKYHYKFWRPITAIRVADIDGNPDTAGDPNWTPFDPVTPPIPDYSSGHAVGAGAGEAVLRGVFGSDTVSPFSYSSTSLPGVTRRFTSFARLGDEIAVSRVYVGYHFRLAVEVGREQGANVGAHVVANYLKPV